MKIEEAIRQKKFESPQQKAMVNLMFTYNWFADLQKNLFAPFDITPQQYNVLRILKGKHPEWLAVSSVKEVMIDKNPDLTRLCDRLLIKGYIEREFNPNNRRQVLLRINKSGIALLAKIKPEFAKYGKKINLSDKEANILSDILDRIRN